MQLYVDRDGLLFLVFSYLSYLSYLLSHVHLCSCYIMRFTKRHRVLPIFVLPRFASYSSVLKSLLLFFFDISSTIYTFLINSLTLFYLFRLEDADSNSSNELEASIEAILCDYSCYMRN